MTTGVGNGGNLQVICIGKNDDQPYLIWQNNTTGTCNYFGTLPNSNATPYSAVANGIGNAGNLQVVLIGKNDDQLYLIWQNRQGWWKDHGALPNPSKSAFSSVAIGIGNAGNFQVVCTGPRRRAALSDLASQHNRYRVFRWIVDHGKHHWRQPSAKKREGKPGCLILRRGLHRNNECQLS
ncbi:MAG: hypothetical protein WBS24_04590 [Terriglobales bacterium]